ncbi:MAG: hypothetical protein PF495_10035 [Spirochaetales bacterium]|jgi:hypothetical protein|nr:hypothetical protein [Spirochaetales bacterium]
MAHKYTTVRLLSTTYRLLKIEAAIRGVSLASLLDKAVKGEISKTMLASERKRAARDVQLSGDPVEICLAAVKPDK